MFFACPTVYNLPKILTFFMQLGKPHVHAYCLQMFGFQFDQLHWAYNMNLRGPKPKGQSSTALFSGAPIENIVQKHLNMHCWTYFSI